MKRSKYESLVSQTFEIEYKGVEYKVDVLDTEMIEKTSKKTGRTYKVRRLWVCLSGSDNDFEISTQSWNKKSFMRNLLKSEGVGHLVVANSELGTVAEPTFQFINGVLHSNISALIKFGEDTNLFDVYFEKYHFSAIKEELESIYDYGVSNQDYSGAINSLEMYMSRVTRASLTMLEFEQMSLRCEIQINGANLKRYMEAYMLEKYERKIESLINALRDKLAQMLFDFIYNGKGIGSIGVSKFGFDKCTTEREVKKLYRKLSKELHPDCGGDEVKFIEMKKEYDKALQKVA